MHSQYNEYYNSLHYLNGFLNLPNFYPYDGKFPKKYNEYLKRTRYFFNLLSIPNKKIKIIHIAGTAGKGSTANFIQSILTQDKYTVGLFTTPYATSFIEEFKVGDKYIAPNELVSIINYLKPFIDKAYATSPYGGPSHFEIKTAIALLYFIQKNCDYIVLEAGLGGEFDATNVLTNKVACAITNIGFDHTNILGSTLTEIAKAKAGIINSKAPVFTTETKPAILKIFSQTAIKNKSPITIISSNQPNQTLAAAVCSYLGASSKTIKKGLKKTFLPARIELMPDSRVVIDGAHNENKIRFTLNRLHEIPHSKLWIIYASAQNKPAEKILKILSTATDKLILTKFKNPFRPCYNPYDLAKKIKPMVVFMDNTMALNFALKNAKPYDLILVTGSFFLAGELRTQWYSEKFILKKRASH